VAPVVRAGRAALPQGGEQAAARGSRAHAADLLLQQWFNLSDPGAEEALYDSAGMRQFVGVDLGCESAPDETTVCKFRHLLEAHHLGEQILGTVNLQLQEASTGMAEHAAPSRHGLIQSFPRMRVPPAAAAGPRPLEFPAVLSRLCPALWVSQPFGLVVHGR
jgi:IS5 family transposase